MPIQQTRARAQRRADRAIHSRRLCPARRGLSPRTRRPSPRHHVARSACDPDDPATWTQPVIRLGYYGDEPFRRAVNTSACSTPPSTSSSARDAGGRVATSAPFRCGFPSRTIPAMPAGMSMSAFPARSTIRTNSDDFSAWRANVTSRGRALLMLFLFSDVGEADAPTRIRSGSHRDIARLLEPAGEAGLSHRSWTRWAADRPEVLATGDAGTVYLCHPFLVHAAQLHRGSTAALHGAAAAASGRAFPAARADGDYSPSNRHSARLAGARVRSRSWSGYHPRSSCSGSACCARRCARHYLKLPHDVVWRCAL